MIHIVLDFLVEILIPRFYFNLVGTFRISFSSVMSLSSVFLLNLISYRSLLCWSSADTKRRREVSLHSFQMVCVTLKEMIWWCIQRQSVNVMVSQWEHCGFSLNEVPSVFCVQMIWSVVILLASALSVGEYLHTFPTVWEVKITCDRLLWKTVVVKGQTRLLMMKRVIADCSIADLQK